MVKGTIRYFPQVISVCQSPLLSGQAIISISPRFISLLHIDPEVEPLISVSAPNLVKQKLNLLVPACSHRDEYYLLFLLFVGEASTGWLVAKKAHNNRQESGKQIGLVGLKVGGATSTKQASQP